MKRLCLFGGSFDPVHLGHAAMAEAALGPGGQERLWVLPAARPPHKPDGLVASPEQRLAMARLAFAGRERITVCDLEIRRGGISYTIDTLRACRAAAGAEVELALLIGADSLPELPAWKEWRELLRLCRLLVVPRPGHPTRVADALGDRLDPAETLRLAGAFLPVPAVELSSSEVRRRVAQAGPWEALVAPEVARYIRAHGLYGLPGCSR